MTTKKDSESKITPSSVNETSDGQPVGPASPDTQPEDQKHQATPLALPNVPTGGSPSAVPPTAPSPTTVPPSPPPALVTAPPVQPPPPPAIAAQPESNPVEEIAGDTAKGAATAGPWGAVAGAAIGVGVSALSAMKSPQGSIAQFQPGGGGGHSTDYVAQASQSALIAALNAAGKIPTRMGG